MLFTFDALKCAFIERDLRITVKWKMTLERHFRILYLALLVYSMISMTESEELRNPIHEITFIVSQSTSIFTL